MQRETVQYRAPQDTDEVGDPIGPAPSWIDIPRCRVWPRESDEQGTTVIISGFGVHIPAGAETPMVNPLGRMKVRGNEYEVDGQPGDFARKGQIVYLTRVGSRNASA